jgi:hypothetical protein
MLRGFHMLVAKGVVNGGADRWRLFMAGLAETISVRLYDKDAKMMRIDRDTDIAKKAHGLTDDAEWDVPPDEVKRLYDAWERQYDKIEQAVMKGGLTAKT